MARKFLELEEAAKMLGLTPDSLNEIRERREIYGYRDGASWKFKSEDVEKLMADRAATAEEGEFAEVDEDPDSILLSEVELGQSDESTSSTIIGGRSSRKDSPDSDIQLVQPKHDSDVNLDAAVGSDVKGGSDVLEMGSGVSPMFDDLDSLDLDMASAADSGVISGASTGSSLELGKEGGTSAVTLGSDALKLEPGSNLAFGGEDQLALGEASGLEMTGSNAGGSAIDLVGADEDGDLVLGGSSHGDLSRTGDSGIGLMNPADSGLSLESAPLQLGGSAVESLDLGEEDMLQIDEPAAKSGAKSGAAAQPQTDDDFLLTPLEEAGVEESDSGSQVIALEGDVEFEEAGAGGAVGTLEPAEGMGLLEEDLGEGLGAAATLGASALSPAAAGAAPAGPVPPPEPAYSGWNVASLVMCSLLLLLSGMLSYDLLRNMWSWNGPYSVNSSMMDVVLSWFQK